MGLPPVERGRCSRNSRISVARRLIPRSLMNRFILLFAIDASLASSIAPLARRLRGLVLIVLLLVMGNARVWRLIAHNEETRRLASARPTTTRQSKKTTTASHNHNNDRSTRRPSSLLPHSPSSSFQHHPSRSLSHPVLPSPDVA